MPASPARSRGNRFDDGRHPLGHPGDLFGALVAMELRCLQAGAMHDVDHALLRNVAKDSDGQRFSRNAGGDVTGSPRSDLAHRPRYEIDANRVSAERYGQERIIDGRDATDLHEGHRAASISAATPTDGPECFTSDSPTSTA